MILQDTLRAVLGNPLLPPSPSPEVPRELARSLTLRATHATVLTGVRRSGKSTLMAQLMRESRQGAFYCNFADTRLFGFSPDDFPTWIALAGELAPPSAPLFLDEVQEVPEWPRLVRTLVDAGRIVCLTGSNASLLGREVGARLTGRHLSFEVFPFAYAEYCRHAGVEPDGRSLRGYLDAGGFPGFLNERNDQVLQELLRDVVERDVAARHRLRETRHVMNLLLFLLANTGQPFSFQRLTKTLGVPMVAQTSRYLEFLVDAYLLVPVARFSPSFRQRVVAPPKYYAIDTGLGRANSPQLRTDVGHRLENTVALHLRRRSREVHYAAERDAWECDFVTEREVIQVAAELTPFNRAREVRGLVEAHRLAGGRRRALVLTLDQSDSLREDGLVIDVRPAWRWLASE